MTNDARKLARELQIFVTTTKRVYDCCICHNEAVPFVRIHDCASFVCRECVVAALEKMDTAALKLMDGDE